MSLGQAGLDIAISHVTLSDENNIGPAEPNKQKERFAGTRWTWTKYTAAMQRQENRTA